MTVVGEAIAPSIETSPAVEALAKALASAQAKIATAAKSAINPHFGKTYADLASVWDAIREPLTSNGLSVVQLPLTDGAKVGVSTTLLHASGQWMRSTLWLTPERPGPQAMGSCLTYGRRYALSAVAGVAPDDDDGNAAQGDPNKKWVAGPKGAADPKAPAPNGNQGAPSATTPSHSKAADIKHDGTRATPKQVTLLHTLKSKLGIQECNGSCVRDAVKVTKTKGNVPITVRCIYHTQLAKFTSETGQPITTSKDLSESQMSNLLERYQGQIAKADDRTANLRPIDVTPLDRPASNVRDLTRKLAQERDIAADDILSIFGVDSLEQLSEADAVNAYALVSAWGTDNFDRVRDSIQTR